MIVEYFMASVFVPGGILLEVFIWHPISKSVWILAPTLRMQRVGAHSVPTSRLFGNFLICYCYMIFHQVSKTIWNPWGNHSVYLLIAGGLISWSFKIPNSNS